MFGIIRLRGVTGMSDCSTFLRFSFGSKVKGSAPVVNVQVQDGDLPCSSCRKYAAVVRLCKLRGHIFPMEAGCMVCMVYKAHLVDCLGCKHLGKQSK